MTFREEISMLWPISLQFCMIWVASNYFYNAGLAGTSVASSTVLNNSSSMFVYMFGFCLLPNKKFSWVRSGMVLCSFAGIVVITLGAKDGESKDTVKGDLFSLLSALFYGLYATYLKSRVPDEDNFSFSYFLGFVGAFNCIICLPIFPILNWTGCEPFQWPNPKALG